MNADPAVRIYTDLLNNIAPTLAHIDQKTAAGALTAECQKLAASGVVCSFEGGKLSLVEAGEGARKALYDAIMSFAVTFEGQYGVDRTWAVLRNTIIRFLQGCRDEVRTYGVEIPISRYSMKYKLLETLFTKSAVDLRGARDLYKPVTVTNQRLIFAKEGGVENVPLQSLVTLDREVYVGAITRDMNYVVRAIDYQTHSSGFLSCAILVAGREVMEDFMRTASVLRAEARRLSLTETKVLIALYNGVNVAQLNSAMGREGVEECLKRLVELGCSDQGGHLTAYGINAAGTLVKTDNKTEKGV
jgi:hypothetical protein